MKRLLCSVFLAAIIGLCFFNDLVAQEDFYYSRGKKIPLLLSTKKLSVKFKSGVTEAQIQGFLLREPLLDALKPLRPATATGFFTIELKGLKSSADVKPLIQRLSKISEVSIVNPVYLAGGLEAISFDHFVVQFEPSIARTEIERLNNQHNVEIVNVSTAAPNLYTFRITSTSDLSVLEMSKLYYESLPCEWSLPDFIIPMELFSTPNDPYFQNQYYFHNTVRQEELLMQTLTRLKHGILQQVVLQSLSQ